MEEEPEIAPRALHDRARVGQHGRHGLPPPIGGGLGRGKRVLHPALGFRPKVALLEVRIGVQERAGVRAVAGGTHLTDVEVLAEIRRRRDELPAHRHVPDRCQANHAERTGEKRTGTSGTPAQRGVPCRMAGQRDGTEHHEEKQVSPAEHRKAERHPGQHETAQRGAEVQHERARREDETERRLLQGPVVVHGRDEQTDQQGGQIPHGHRTRDPPAEQRGQTAGHDAEDALNHTNQQEAPTEDGIQSGEEIGVERVDPERSLSSRPIPARDALGPFVVVGVIQLKLVDERGPPEEADVGEPQYPRDHQDGREKPRRDERPIEGSTEGFAPAGRRRFRAGRRSRTRSVLPLFPLRLPRHWRRAPWDARQVLTTGRSPPAT